MIRPLSETLASVLGEKAPRELDLAERIAEGVLAASGVVLGDEAWKAIVGIARATGGEKMRQGEAALDALDDLRRQGLTQTFASDAAADRFAPEIESAFYLGLAVGHRLGASGIGGRP